jgi:hypothetical protein
VTQIWNSTAKKWVLL